MDTALAFLGIGGLVIVSAWMPLFLTSVPVSLAMVAVSGGIVCGLLGVPAHILRVAELETLVLCALLVAVLGGGLKLDRRFAPVTWGSTWRLLGLVMPLSIGAIATLSYFLLGLPAGLSLLLGAALAPTDPVLASEYAAGPPGTGEEDETRFALTSEAGLNDGAAYPFVMLGLLITQGHIGASGDLWQWLLRDMLWNVTAGAAIGIGLGWVLVKVNAWLPNDHRLSASNSGLVAVGLAFVAYALALLVDGNGFVAVFCEAVTIRNLVDVVAYSRRLNHAADQFESLGMVLVLAGLGVALANGLLDEVGWRELAFAALVLLIVRPFGVALGMLGTGQDRATRIALGYFGIRGIASIYYVAHVGPQLAQADARHLYALVGLVVLSSVMLYGTTARLVGDRLRAYRQR
ncbi:cation:proton antiporter [Bradyrhizobium sp. ORS 375]|uniref:cation:proton antiporter n=1 Tax=Bradyrhizobium sp. (strain ORS 375) TaxID=566679 RepID=UPI000556C29C|nr:cation:proton antiporter [Bradyrhizobium sp. ORS 375]